MDKKVELSEGIGLLGCGNISSVYLENLTTRFAGLNVVALSDLDLSKAEKQADKYNIPKVCTPEEMLEDDDIGFVLNLTVPGAHYKTALSVLKAGKGLYMEKPLAATLKEGKAILREAHKRNLPLGGAPDTFLGSAIATAGALIGEGVIGKPVGASAFMVGGGPESWHPDPGFFYSRGGGPVLDMAPYYLTALLALLGPVSEVIGRGSRAFTHKTVGTGPKKGNRFPVEVDTFNQSLLTFRNGVIGTMTFSFDTPGGSGNSHIEICGTEGSIRLPDPNWFGGDVYLRKSASDDWSKVPLRGHQVENLRGLGLLNMIRSWKQGKSWEASGERQLHILEIMTGMIRSAGKETGYKIKNTCEKPEFIEVEYER